MNLVGCDIIDIFIKLVDLKKEFIIGLLEYVVECIELYYIDGKIIFDDSFIF